MCKNSLACIISLINVYNHLHSEVSQICFEGGVAKTLYIPYKLILIGGVANQNNFATPPKYLRHLLTMQLKSRVKTNLRHFPTILTGDARPRFFESYALLEEQVRRARSDDGRL